MTKAHPQAPAAPEAVREIIRRAGHEIRNALNGVSVNIEVVRSRAAREESPKDVASFAERASAQVGEASALTDGLLAFVDSVLTAQAEGTLRTTGGRGAGSQVELTISGDRGAILLSDIERLASRTALGVEQRGQRVILRLLPEGKSHSKD